MTAATAVSVAGQGTLLGRRAGLADVHLWRLLHAEDHDMMFELPRLDEQLWAQMQRCNAHLVHDNQNTVIGGFTLSVIQPGLPSYGIVIASEKRGQGYAKAVVALSEQTARSMSVHTLRADVYADNAACLSALQKNGFRPFVWLEKNI